MLDVFCLFAVTVFVDCEIAVNLLEWLDCGLHLNLPQQVLI